MSGERIAKGDIVAGWTVEQIDSLELSFLHEALLCDKPASVEVAAAYAGFMSQHSLDSDNYPVFLKLLQLQNHWVADALLDGTEPEHFFDTVQPNRFILASCFTMLGAYRPGEIYQRTLLVVIGLLKRSYEQPRDGYRVYPLTVTDVNNLAKHLDESEDQSFPLNQNILHLLDRIASLADPGVTPPSEKQMADVATQANNIRGKFLDITKHVREAIPTEMLQRGDYRESEVAPTSAAKNGKNAAAKAPATRTRTAPAGGKGKPAARAKAGSRK